MKRAKLLLATILAFSTMGGIYAYAYQSDVLYYKTISTARCTWPVNGFTLVPPVPGQAAAGLWYATTVFDGSCTIRKPYYTGS